MVKDSAEALLTVINDILDVSKLEAGRLELESVDFDLAEIVEGAVTLLSPQAREKGIDLAVFVHPAVPPSVFGDPTRLRQVALNLVGNGVKFTASGGVSLKVLPGVPTRRAPDAATALDSLPLVRFEITDTGIGIPPDVQLRLFQKFMQADSSVTRRFGGTGLGLAICRELVGLMGGEIGVESEVGRGTTFWF